VRIDRRVARILARAASGRPPAPTSAPRPTEHPDPGRRER
jgi:hypothetical protein